MYLRVTGLLSLIIILIISVYYYLQSNRSKILEKFGNYDLRECKVYFTEGDTEIQNCDITQETSNYTGTCSYRFDGWKEFDYYIDSNGNKITYPKKVYTPTRTNTNDFNNPMFTNNCFKAYTTDTCIPGQPTDNCIPPEFEYNTNGIVKYDEIGRSGNTAVGNNIYGGMGYSSMQFLNTPDPITNNTNLISSICDVPLNDALGSLNNRVFYRFEFNATTNKLENITSVSLNSDQTTFSPVSSDNVLTNLPLRPTDASFYGLQYDATNRNLPIKIFKKNNILRNVAIFKFNYMSYICTQSQIKNYMTARRNIYPEKFIKYGSSTTPNYSKNISVSNNMTIKKDWNWSDYSSSDFNVDYSDMLNTDLTTSINERKSVIKRSYAAREEIANQEYDTANEMLDAASQSRRDFATNNPTFSSLIGKRNATSTSSIFDYKRGYNTSTIDNLNFSIPRGATANKVGNDFFIITFPYNANNNINGQSQYNITTGTEGVVCDVLVVGGGGGGGKFGGGGGGGGILFATNITLTSGTIRVGNGGAGDATPEDTADGENGKDSSITIKSIEYIAKGGGSGGGRGINAQGRNGVAGGSGGGGSGTNVSSSVGYGGVSNKNTYANFQSFGNNGGQGRPNITGNQPIFSSGGGGGAGSIGSDFSYTTGGGNGGAGKDYSAYFGTNVGHNGWFGGGGGGNTYLNAGTRGFGNGGNGLLGGGGNGGFDGGTEYSGDDALPNTGGGGGGSKWDGSGSLGGGNGGSGIVIIRIKINNNVVINNNNIITPFKTLDTTINTFYSNEPSNTSIITIDASSIQPKILTSFVFLQKGYYYFKPDINGGGYHSSMMIYSDLLLFDEANNDASKKPPTYNARIVYKNNNGDLKVFNKRIYIPDSKFYKLAYRYTICNTTTNRISANFVLDCNYRAVEPALNPSEYVNLNSNVNNAIGNYIGLNDIIFNGSLIDYLFCGVNLNNDYKSQVIMSSLSNVKYGDNNKDTYANIITYLDSINFFNIANLQKDMKTKKNYMEVVLPGMIIAEYGTDENIQNINKFIDKIDELKSNRAIVNYSSQLPTTSPSLYKDITIDEIFGRNYDRLITKERVNPTNPPTEIPTKKIYVEALALPK